MRVLDTNEKHQLALICNDDTISGVKYIPLAEAKEAASLTLYGSYLKQAHYVARTTAIGLTANTRPMLDGWERAKDMGDWPKYSGRLPAREIKP